MSAFEELGLNSELCELLEKNEIDLPTAIQQESIPLILGGGDLCASAETGTGKTLSFIISSLQIVNELFRNIGCYQPRSVENVKRTKHGEEKKSVKSERKGGESHKEEGTVHNEEIRLVMGKLNNSTKILSAYECICNNTQNNQGIRGCDEILVDCTIKKGKYAYEIEILSKSFISVGFCPVGNEPFRNCYTYRNNQTKYNNEQVDKYGESYGPSDIITCLIDKDNNNIAFHKNGRYLGKAFNIYNKFADVPFVPYICGKFFHVKFHFNNLKFIGTRGYQEIGNLYKTKENRENREREGYWEKEQQHMNNVNYKESLLSSGKNHEMKQSTLSMEKDLSSFTTIMNTTTTTTNNNNNNNNSNNNNNNNNNNISNENNQKKLFCIVLSPTKDLAMQTYNNYLIYAECFTNPPINIGVLVGGETNRKRQNTSFNILVCTCFKLLENIKRHAINLNDIRLLILDEADELINSDEQSVLQIKECIMQHSNSNVQTLFFSATLQDDNVRKCINKITNKPIFVDLKYGKHYIPSHIYVCIYYVNENSFNISYKSENKDIYNVLKNETLENMSFNDLYEYTDKVHLLNTKGEKEKKSLQIKINKLQKLIHIINVFNMENGIIFCRTNLDCDNVYNFLNLLGDGKCYKGTVETMKENRYSCVVLKGKMPIHERQNNLNAFKKGEVRFLICTDVASRGIDIKNLRHLIIFTLTDNINTFFHKIGRVGRDGSNSLCIVLAADNSVEEKVWFHTCPSRGVNCFNRNLKKDNGCTVYINESEYIQSINDILETPMHVLDSKYFYAENIVDPLNYLSTNPTTNKSRRNKNQEATTIFSDKPYKCILKDFNTTINTIRKMQSIIHYEHFGVLRDAV